MPGTPIKTTTNKIVERERGRCPI
ncbi:Truncated env protein [Caenorhabditis elegans]|uniref:Truncated env protein n=1 Tax=Caenorhabditis elegans TaxID=6239 RepID=A0A2K5ATZ6_CAEEL|nr:Truncated env protein [Caenorhabditis elegans]SPC48659.2 Truncated env protein [Caenorhabditis elegans]|eukprot:NP_001348798.2 Uncharacterized protein CELE_C34D10.5 [Caenorhabditis elegans]